MATLYDNVIANAGMATIPLGILRIEGRDARTWLHKIVTADVGQMQTGHGAHSALLDAKGHFAAEFMLLRDGDAMGALTDISLRETLLAILKRYIIREKVTISDVSERWTCITLIGMQAAAVVEQVLEVRAPTGLYDWAWGHVGESAARVIRSVRARVPSYDVVIPNTGLADLQNAIAGVPQITDELVETLRIEAGLPRWGVDFDGSTLALEVPDVMQIRVDQGCYVGQEVVARIVHRGHVNRHLRGLRIETASLPPRGEPIRFEGAEVGNVTSAARSPMLGNIALGYVRRHVEPGAVVQLDHTTARVIELPFPIL